jgi:hypothetical protein
MNHKVQFEMESISDFSGSIRDLNTGKEQLPNVPFCLFSAITDKF